MSAPDLFWLLAVVVLALHLVFDYLFPFAEKMRAGDSRPLLLAVLVILLVLALWFFPIWPAGVRRS